MRQMFGTLLSCVSPSTITVSLCVLTLLLMVLRGRMCRTSYLQKQKFPPPPGPRPWPLVGNLLQMGDQMHLSLTRLRFQYGDVFKV